MRGIWLLVVVINETQVSKAVKCDPGELRPCHLSFTMSMEPSSACCKKVLQHRTCYCEYSKNPKTQPYLKYDATQRIISDCGVAIPTC
ncbi:hypothetical protein Csa_006987 [Cucumis sativus]|uniref:Bifunctional inhibitor/plant lipid transfer protein/seed storage helical domain-containing protein n=1 Tax=Cucumis sativus TaxID=3659 RepID=A0A0A0M3W7_CUCSA|nr:hypothetical protein Csa_006987 [Cucumis sativus]